MNGIAFLVGFIAIYVLVQLFLMSMYYFKTPPWVDNDAIFHKKLVQEIKDRGLKEEDVARLFGVSKPSVRHWMQGTCLPHPAMRKVMIKRFKLKKASGT